MIKIKKNLLILILQVLFTALNSQELDHLRPFTANPADDFIEQLLGLYGLTNPPPIEGVNYNAIFQCPECKTIFCKREYWTKHIKTSHPDLKHIQCPHCHEKVSSDIDLISHTSRYHSDKKPFNCLFCGKGYTGRHMLNRHKCKNVKTVKM
jgi:hypothetical protein